MERQMAGRAVNRRELQAARHPPGAEPAGGPPTPPAFLIPGDGTVPTDMVMAVTRAVIAVLTWQAGAVRDQAARPSSMLTVAQAAALMGTSRATVIRKADAGELPCLVVSRGPRQKMRRFPRALIEDLAARGGLGAETDIADYAARWHATTARQTPVTTNPLRRNDQQ